MKFLHQIYLCSFTFIFLGSLSAFGAQNNLCHNFASGDFACDDAKCREYKDDDKSETTCIVGGALGSGGSTGNRTKARTTGIGVSTH